MNNHCLDDTGYLCILSKAEKKKEIAADEPKNLTLLPGLFCLPASKIKKCIHYFYLSLSLFYHIAKEEKNTGLHC